MLEYLTKKDIIKELLSSGKDPAYFIDTYCQITHPIHGLIPFKLYDFQKDMLRAFNDYPWNIILKSRQLGASTTVAAYIAWLMIFHKEKNIVVIATKFKVAGGLVKKVKGIIKNLPEFFDQMAKIAVDNRTSFVLTNGSNIEASATSEDAGRSDALSLLVVDEAAHIANFEEIWTALSPTLATGGRCIALSSPKGVGNWFFNEYSRAEKGESQFHPIKLTWEVHPERDGEWEKKERKKFSTKKFQQEYAGNFLASGETVIGFEELQKVYQNIKKPIKCIGFDKAFWIWEEYKKIYNYILTADVARGDDSDYSTIQVLNLSTMEQAAEFKGKPSHDVFAKIVYDIGIEYGYAMIAVENNSLGHDVNTRLLEMKYPNIYHQTKGDHKFVPQYMAQNTENVIPGWTTSRTNRDNIFYRFEESVRMDMLVLNSERTYKELETFIWNKGRPEAQSGHNDDLIVPLAIACTIREDALKEASRGLQYKKTFLKSMILTQTKLNTTIPGMVGFNRQLSSWRGISQTPSVNQMYRSLLKG